MINNISLLLSKVYAASQYNGIQQKSNNPVCRGPTSCRIIENAGQFHGSHCLATFDYIKILRTVSESEHFF